MYWTAREAGMAEVFGPKELGGRMASSWGTEDGILVDGLIRWIDSDANRPFYAMMWTDQTHHPYTLAHDTQPIDFLDETKTPNGELLKRVPERVATGRSTFGTIVRGVAPTQSR